MLEKIVCTHQFLNQAELSRPCTLETNTGLVCQSLNLSKCSPTVLARNSMKHDVTTAVRRAHFESSEAVDRDSPASQARVQRPGQMETQRALGGVTRARESNPIVCGYCLINERGNRHRNSIIIIEPPCDKRMRRSDWTALDAICSPLDE